MRRPHMWPTIVATTPMRGASKRTTKEDIIRLQSGRISLCMNKLPFLRPGGVCRQVSFLFLNKN